MTTLSVNIPFAGFYCSKWSDIVDRAAELDIEHFVDERQSDPSEECYQPEEAAHLDAGEIADLYMKHTDHSAAYLAIARDYTDAFGKALGEVLGFNQRLVFEEMTSPRFYNSETDRIFAIVPLETVKAWIAISRRADKHATLARLFADRFTSRDGFLSYYANSIPRRDVDDWDHNELGTLLLAVMELRIGDASEFDEDLLWAIAEYDFEYLEAALDWRALCDAAKALQAEKIEAIAAEDPDYVPPLPRCTDTVDMFTGRLG